MGLPFKLASLDRHQLILQLQEYDTAYPEEKKYREDFLQLLRDERCFYRDHLPGHITGSVWITDELKENFLLILHTKLNKWLQPGGHADGDENVLRVALREMQEETALQQYHVHPSLFDIDIHEIGKRNGFPAHLHYDVRFLVIASPSADIRNNEESLQMKWIHIQDLARYNSDRSVMRMAEKLKNNRAT